MRDICIPGLSELRKKGEVVKKVIQFQSVKSNANRITKLEHRIPLLIEVYNRSLKEITNLRSTLLLWISLNLLCWVALICIILGVGVE